MGSSGRSLVRSSVRLFWLACVAIGFWGAPAFAQSAPAAGSTVVFLVRHAEKAAEPAADPPLTAAGEARARALAAALAHAHIGAVISTPYLRTMHTARPIAEALGLRIENVAVSGGVAAHARAVAAAARAHTGKSVLVVGHSNTIPAIATALGAPPLKDFCDGEYDHLLVVEIPVTGPARFVQVRYGAPTSDPACATMR